MIPKVTDYEVYKTYLGISRHFTTESYDYQKYCGKVRCSLQSFYKNKQRFWFEKLSRKYDDHEIKELFVSNYALSEDNSKIWIGNLVREGETLYQEWKKKGWIHEDDPYGWFEWYLKYHSGRRHPDDARQIKRWHNFCGPDGRWRRTIYKKIHATGNWDVSPRIQQSLLHWGYQVNQKDYEDFLDKNDL